MSRRGGRLIRRRGGRGRRVLGGGGRRTAPSSCLVGEDPAPVQFHQFVRRRPAPPGEAVSGREVHRHGIAVAVPVQRGHAHMQLPCEDAVAATGALLQQTQQPRKPLCLCPHPAPLFVPPLRDSVPGSHHSPRSAPISAFFCPSLSRIRPQPNARHAGCTQAVSSTTKQKTPCGLGELEGGGPGDLEADTCPRRCSSAVGLMAPLPTYSGAAGPGSASPAHGAPSPSFSRPAPTLSARRAVRSSRFP